MGAGLNQTSARRSVCCGAFHILRSRREMKRAFKYDVAVSAADFDALTVTELKRRLEHRLSKPVFTVPRAKDAPPDGTTVTAIQKALEKESRVLVIVHQRLWGTTPASEIEVAAIKARIGKVKRKDVLVIPLDTSPQPAWLKGTIVRSSGSPTGAAVIDAIVEAVQAAGGATRAELRRIVETAMEAWPK